MTKMTKTKEFQTSKVFLVSFAHFFHDVYSAFLAPLLPLLRDHLGFNLTFAGLLSVVQRLPTIFNPLVGILAERTAARYFVIITPAVTAIAMSLIGVAPTKAFLVLLVLISGISSSFFHVPSPVMIRKVAGNRIGRGMSFYMVGGELARTVGPVVALGAVDLWGLNGLTRLIPAGLLASIILFYKFKQERISDSMSKSTGYEYLKTIRSILPLIGTIAMIFLFRAAMKSALTFYLPVFLESRGESLWYAGISLSILQAAGVVGTFFAGSLSDKIGQKKMLVICSIASPLLMFGFLYTTGWVQLIVLVFTGIFLFATGPVFLALVNRIKSDHHTLVNGVYMTTTFLIGAIMVMVVGLLGDYLQLETTYKIVAFWSLGAIPFSLAIKDEN
ncbi:MFS transporter [Marinilabiliaceae bacterium JC017]|nr:MFS transporter [Marinilabiliaceae bacterium JC017]